MKRFLVLVMVSILAVSVAFIGGCGDESPTPTTKTVTPGYYPFTPVKLGYGLEFPMDWECKVIEWEDAESVVMFTKPGTPTTLFVTVKLSNLSLEEVMGELREEIEGLGLTIIEEREIVVDDREGYEVICKPIATVKMRQVIFIANGKTYMLVCSTAEVLYDEYRDTFDHIINSFTIRNSA